MALTATLIASVSDLVGTPYTFPGGTGLNGQYRIPITAAVEVGARIFLYVVCWRPTGVGVFVTSGIQSGPTDPRGNTWTGFTDAISGVECILCDVTTRLESGDELVFERINPTSGGFQPETLCAIAVAAAGGSALDWHHPTDPSVNLDRNDEDGDPADPTYLPASWSPASDFASHAIPSYQYRTNPDAIIITSVPDFSATGPRAQILFDYWQLRCFYGFGSPLCPIAGPAVAPSGFSSATVTCETNPGTGGSPPSAGQHFALTVSWLTPGTSPTTVNTAAVTWPTGAFYGIGRFWASWFVRPTTTGDGPWNLETRLGQYHWSYFDTDTSEILYRRSDTSTPAGAAGPFTVASGLDAPPEFRMWEEEYPAARVRGIWVSDGAVVTADSDDDGATWGSTVELWPASDSPKHPTGNHDARTGYTIYMAWVAGDLKGRLQGPGDAAPGASFSTGVSSDDSTFHVFPAADAPGRWLLVVRQSGAITNWMSTDEAASFSAA